MFADKICRNCQKLKSRFRYLTFTCKSFIGKFTESCADASWLPSHGLISTHGSSPHTSSPQKKNTTDAYSIKGSHHHKLISVIKLLLKSTPWLIVPHSSLLHPHLTINCTSLEQKLSPSNSKITIQTPLEFRKSYHFSSFLFIIWPTSHSNIQQS